MKAIITMTTKKEFAHNVRHTVRIHNTAICIKWLEIHSRTGSIWHTYFGKWFFTRLHIYHRFKFAYVLKKKLLRAYLYIKAMAPYGNINFGSFLCSFAHFVSLYLCRLFHCLFFFTPTGRFWYVEHITLNHLENLQIFAHC